MDTKEIEQQLREAVKALLLIPLDDLEQHDKACRDSYSKFDSFAPILDPGAYLTARRNGELDFVKLQNDIGHKCLEVRRLLEQLPVGAKLRILGTKSAQELIEEGNGDDAA